MFRIIFMMLVMCLLLQQLIFAESVEPWEQVLLLFEKHELQDKNDLEKMLQKTNQKYVKLLGFHLLELWDLDKWESYLDVPRKTAEIELITKIKDSYNDEILINPTFAEILVVEIDVKRSGEVELCEVIRGLKTLEKLGYSCSYISDNLSQRFCPAFKNGKFVKSRTSLVFKRNF